jgi:hypothetical protein
MDQESIRTASHYHVTWKESGRIYQALIASLDHVQPIYLGGRNWVENFVAACKYCNERRGKEMELELICGKHERAT